MSLLIICRNLKSQSVALPDKWHQKGTAEAARRRGHPDDAQREGVRSSERASRCKYRGENGDLINYYTMNYYY